MELGFIGFGEASQNLAKGFLQNDDTPAYVYDVDYHKAVESVTALEESECIYVCSSISEVVDSATNIFVAVPGAADEAVFDEITKSAFGGKLFIDICTAKPTVKYFNSLKINTLCRGRLSEKSVEPEGKAHI